MAAFWVILLMFLAVFLPHGVSECPDKTSKKFSGKLKMDQAIVNITTNLAKPITILGISSNCYLCPLQVLHSNVTKHAYILVSTHYDFVLAINSLDGSRMCSVTRLYGEYGWYEYKIREDDKGQLSCDLVVTKEPHNAYIPILVAFIVFVLMAIIWIIYTRYQQQICGLCKKGNSIPDSREDPAKVATSEEVVLQHSGSIQNKDIQVTINTDSEPKRKKRLRSLDTFRGIAITTMLFVNFGHGGYYIFGHADWNGLLFADLIFPWFIWIMGVSITLSFKSIARRKLKSSLVLRKIIRRSLILFGLGVFTSNFNDLEYYRVPGVLQRFAICYFVIALMQLYCPPREEIPKRWWDPVRDVVTLWKQWLIMAFVVTIFLIVTYGVKVGDCPTGYTGPGGIGEGYPVAVNCTGGVANYIDRKFLGNHLYRWATVKTLYKTKLPHDPEGCLGSLTSIFLVFLGVQAGRILHTYPDHTSRLIRWTVWGVLLGLIGIGLCGGTKDEGAIPINKNLWSLSFIFVTGATCFILLAICYLLTDVVGWWNGAPFFYPGMNSILLYVGYGIIYNRFPFTWKTNEYVTHAEKLSMNLLATALWVLISFHLFRKKFFLKI